MGKRIGLFGGTFDPVHIGHMRSAVEMAEQFALDELRLLPNARPPHRETPQVSAAQRLAMVERAVAGVERLTVDPRELQRDKPSYTIDTLESVRAELAADDQLFMLIGWDAFCGCRRGTAGRRCWITATSSCCSVRMPTASRRSRCATCWRRGAWPTRRP